jgi:uncharacterized membrane protein YraQ (UPF0718 family)
MIGWIQHFFHEFLHLFLMVLPYFLLGIGVGALFESKGNFGFISRFLGQGKRSIAYASLMGAILPGCACATMPMAEGLLRKGARLSTACAFIFTSPLLAPQTVILTVALLGPSFAMARILAGLIGGMGIGWIIYALESKRIIQLPDKIIADACCRKTQENPSFFLSFRSIAIKLGGYFFIGLAIAAALTISVPPTAIPDTIGQHPVLSYLIATVIGIPVYICEGEEIPITYSLLSLGLAKGPALTFLLGAVGTCIPTLLFAQKILGKKPMWLYAAYWSIYAPLCGVIFNAFPT